MTFQKSLENEIKIRLSTQDLMETLYRKAPNGRDSPSIGKNTSPKLISFFIVIILSLQISEDQSD